MKFRIEIISILEKKQYTVEQVTNKIEQNKLTIKDNKINYETGFCLTRKITEAYIRDAGSTQKVGEHMYSGVPS